MSGLFCGGCFRGGSCVEAGGVVGEIDGWFFGEGFEDGLPHFLLGSAPLAGVDDVADGEHDAAVFDGGVDDRGERAGDNQVFFCGAADLGLRAGRKGFGVFFDDSLQDGFGFFPVAFEGDHDGDFVPDIFKAGVVVGQRRPEDEAVGNVNDAAGALVGIDPVADLDDAEFEEAAVDDVAFDAVEFDAVAHFERFAGLDEKEAGDVGDGVVQGDGQTGTGQSEEGAERGDSVEPDGADDHEQQGGVHIGDGASNVIAALIVLNFSIDKTCGEQTHEPEHQQCRQRHNDPFDGCFRKVVKFRQCFKHGFSFAIDYHKCIAGENGICLRFDCGLFRINHCMNAVKTVVFFLLTGVLTGLAESEVLTEQTIREETVAAALGGRRSERAEQLAKWISGQMNEGRKLRPEELAALTVAADCIAYLRLTDSLQLDADTERWLLEDPGRLALVARFIRPGDDLPRCFQCLEELIQHDVTWKADYFNLMLALSVVWDAPQRPPIHYQMGPGQLAYTPDLTARYDYFKELYSSGEAKFPYEDLSVRDLLFVVDTPVPVSELQWVREHEDGDLEDWGEKFSDISYDNSRLSDGQYQWSEGAYTLATIQRCGGICVDQTYYALMTARAFGIPALYMHAPGKSGAHAWFAYLTEPGRWTMDVGRYESESYTTGLTRDPQTDREMTDHDLALTDERRSSLQKMAQSDACMAIANGLQSDPVNRRKCAALARKIDPLNRQAWMVEVDALAAAGDARALFHLYEDVEDTFDDYPDVVVAVAEKVLPVLTDAGMDKEAGRLSRKLARNVGDDRDDLARFMGMEEIEKLVQAGDIKKARRKMEGVLEDHIEDGSKAFSMIGYYLDITNGNDQARAAAKFMEDYVADLFRKYSFDIARKQTVLNLLLRAYRQAGDDDGVEETLERLHRL